MKHVNANELTRNERKPSPATIGDLIRQQMGNLTYKPTLYFTERELRGELMRVFPIETVDAAFDRESVYDLCIHVAADQYMRGHQQETTPKLVQYAKQWQGPEAVIFLRPDGFSREEVVQLIDMIGKIPAHHTCPFRSECPLGDGCPHAGIDHEVGYSCASARGYALSEVRAAKKP